MSPRPRKNNVSISGLYARFDRRTAKTYYQYKNPLTGKFHGLGTDKEKAEKIAITANQRITAAEAEHYLRQIDETPKAVVHRGISLKAWIERYLKIQKQSLDAGTLSRKRYSEKTRMAGLLSQRLGSRPMKSLEVKDFAVLLDEYLDAGHASSALCNRVVWVDIFTEAQHAGEVPPGWNPPGATKKPSVKVTRSRLSLEEWKRILTQIPEDRYAHKAMLLALVTGQRRDDIANMKFSDIKDGYLHIEQSKTCSRIALPLTLRCEAIGMSLEEVIRKCRDRFVSPYLLHGKRNNTAKPVNLILLSKEFAEARDAAGITPPAGKTPTTFHEQRSLSERLYRAQGIDTKILLGHKTQSTTDRYNDDRGKEWIKLAI
ncbi:integrase [Enterobacter sp. CGMCC 5087]|uniref:phage integrase Arm DNA-binding domain-containing protein n=1 Tax=Enterobacter sp. CGMCC 5087 TaxID=2183878 RepID=UPI000D674FA8|nr:phage integrase Arm DNA-binding domain-containing protein [Enterobacter sp. CGMCC 5087]PWI80303.1 integrase [Enterobacter sp. CGMCC 5087]